jgi:hypothetical protein
LVDHRGVNATSAFYSTASAVVPIDALESRASKLPPYGREVADAVHTGKNPNVYVFAGADAWKRASNRRDARGPGETMLLPPGEDPTAYRWPAVPGGVLIVAIGQSRQVAFNLAQVVVSDGTPRALAIFGNNDSLIVKERAA